MRVTFLVPGTGSFYCGSCLRDASLARAVRSLGHDAVIVPLYLPLHVERDDETSVPIRMGGINVWLQERSKAFGALPKWLAALLDSPALLRLASRGSDMTSASAHGALAVSILRGEDGRQVREVEKLAESLAGDSADVICLSNAMLIGLARRVRDATGAAILCTLQGELPFLDALAPPHREEAWREIAERSADVDRFVAVSRWYGDAFAARAGIGAERIRIVHNGIDLDGLGTEAAERPARPRTLGYLARLCEDKGLPTLIEAFCMLAARRGFEDVRLCAVGAALPPDLALVRRLSKRLAAAGLGDRASFHPNVDRAEKLRLLRTFTVMSVPATYGESFGLYVLEALAAGVPVVQPRHGAFPELLEATGGGIICPPDDPRALAQAIGELLDDEPRARSLGAIGRRSVMERFGSQHMAQSFLDVCAEIAGDRACRTNTR